MPDFLLSTHPPSLSGISLTQFLLEQYHNREKVVGVCCEYGYAAVRTNNELSAAKESTNIIVISITIFLSLKNSSSLSNGQFPSKLANDCLAWQGH